MTVQNKVPSIPSECVVLVALIRHDLPKPSFEDIHRWKGQGPVYICMESIGWPGTFAIFPPPAFAKLGPIEPDAKERRAVMLLERWWKQATDISIVQAVNTLWGE